MYELIFTIMVITKSGVPGFNIEHVSRFQLVEDCDKTKKSMEGYMDKLVRDGKAFPGVFNVGRVIMQSKILAKEQKRRTTIDYIVLVILIVLLINHLTS